MKRIQLLSFRGLLVTVDTAAALTALDEQAKQRGWVLDLMIPHNIQEGDLSLHPAGREVLFRFKKEGVDRQTALNAAWAHAVPLGFTPWQRYPKAGGLYSDTQIEIVFHFLGPWHPIVDRMMAEGRGHLAWPSLCAAAQTDVGEWRGDAEVERFVQGQLHRLGYNCGPVDGKIGTRTARVLESMGLKQSSLAQVAAKLQQGTPDTPQKKTRCTGHVVVPGRQLVVSTHGDVQAVRSDAGCTLMVDGPGRVVLDIGDST